VEARRVALNLALGCAALALAGCGGKEAAPGPPCSDAAFRDQAEELYVAQSTAQNAATTAVDPALLRQQLRQGIKALRSYVAAHPPCADDLKTLAEQENGALDELDAAVARIQASPVPAQVRADLVAAVAKLRQAQTKLGAVG